MNQDVKKYSVSILNENYTIVSDESEISVHQATQCLNQILNEIVAKAPHLDAKKVAVFAAFKLAMAKISSIQERESIERTVAQLSEQAARALQYEATEQAE